MSLPAKRVPMALMHLVEWYRAERKESETVLQFLKRMGAERIRGELAPFSKVVGFHQERDLYYDWGSDERFTFQKPPPGEC